MYPSFENDVGKSVIQCSKSLADILISKLQYFPGCMESLK